MQVGMLYIAVILIAGSLAVLPTLATVVHPDGGTWPKARADQGSSLISGHEKDVILPDSSINFGQYAPVQLAAVKNSISCTRKAIRANIRSLAPRVFENYGLIKPRPVSLAEGSRC